MSTITAPRPSIPLAHSTPTAPERSSRCLGAYHQGPGDTLREVAALRGAQHSTLVIDRIAITHDDARLVAHLAADEPDANAAIVCELYLADETRGQCRALCAEDLRRSPGTPTEMMGASEADWRSTLRGAHGVTYAIRVVRCDGAGELRWVRSRPSFDGAREVEPLTLREVIGALQDYEPARSITTVALAAHACEASVCCTRLAGELRRLATSTLVLNRGLREAVQRALVADGLSLNAIAMRCGRIKRDARGGIAGETSWLRRRIGEMPDGGKREPGSWVHSDVLALIAREGLGLSPLEVEVG
ncbi:MAG: hypothetical protein ACYDA6_07450 [Solirubrobacteraceae bacterium]